MIWVVKSDILYTYILHNFAQECRCNFKEMYHSWMWRSDFPLWTQTEIHPIRPLCTTLNWKLSTLWIRAAVCVTSNQHCYFYFIFLNLRYAAEDKDFS